MFEHADPYVYTQLVDRSSLTTEPSANPVSLLLCLFPSSFPYNAIDPPNMPKTHKVLTSPATGTQVYPVYHYDEEQKGKLKALSEVRILDLHGDGIAGMTC